MMKQLKSLLNQLNGSDLQGNAMLVQQDWTNSIGEKYRHFGASYPTPECFISHIQIAERSANAEPKEMLRETRSENYRDKNIRIQFWDRCRNFFTSIQFLRMPIVFV